MWVFGYGSLIWNPEFPVAARQVACVEGWRRSFCMRSIHHRGTEGDPGLVLALDRATEGACGGVGFKVRAGAEAATLAALRARELISSAYEEVWLPMRLSCGAEVAALAYVIDRDHPQYCGALALEEQARIIARAIGKRGSNRDYLFSTADHLADLGIADPDLVWLALRVRELAG